VVIYGGSPSAKQSINLDGSRYSIDVSLVGDRLLAPSVQQPETRMDIVVPVFIPNESAFELASVCLESLSNFCPDNINIWAVDNNSPSGTSSELSKIPRVNVITNHTEPRSPRVGRLLPKLRMVRNKLLQNRESRQLQMFDGSYANAIAIEIALAVIGHVAENVITLHSDTVITRHTSINEFLRHLDGNVRAVGYRRDPGRAHALHVAGLLFDWPAVQALGGKFFPEDVTQSQKTDGYDCGDLVTILLEQSGFKTVALKNTYNDPSLESQIKPDDPFRDLKVDRVLDESGNVVFAHLGRGTSMAFGGELNSSRVSPRDWVNFVRTEILSDGISE